jgi:hypothetical protein
MPEFAHSTGQFERGWKGNNTKREALFGDLIGIIHSCTYRSFSCIVEYADLHKLSPENQKAYALNAYSLAGRTCVKHVSDWRKREPGMLEIPTGFAFEEGDEGAGMLSDRMWKDGYPKPHFLPKKKRLDRDGSPVYAYTPLQAADILAYEIFRLHHDQFEEHPRFTTFSSWRWGLRQFANLPGADEWGYYSPRDLAALNAKLESLSEDPNPNAIS